MNTALKTWYGAVAGLLSTAVTVGLVTVGAIVRVDSVAAILKLRRGGTRPTA